MSIPVLPKPTTVYLLCNYYRVTKVIPGPHICKTKRPDKTTNFSACLKLFPCQEKLVFLSAFLGLYSFSTCPNFVPSDEQEE